MFSIDGLVSGFDTTSIINSLLEFQASEVGILNSRKAEIATRQSAFGGIEAQLVALQGALGRLNRVSSVFDARTASSSNEDVLTAVASSDATPGSYSLTVNSLATAEQLGSQGFSSENAEIGTGEVTLRIGSQETTTITIDETNNNLTDFVNAINAQSDDVSASIVFDQGADSYRVLLTSSETGAENAIEFTANLTGGDVPDFSGPAVQEATDASVTLGSGPGAITASYSSNQIDGLISGVTIDLNAVETTNPVTITVGSDTAGAVDAVEDFVDAYNSVISFIDDQTAFNPETSFASPLLGNRNVNSIRDTLLNSVIENVPGLSVGLSRLADIGVDIDTNGRLEVDSARLNDAFSGNIDGIDPDEIRNLFGLNGSTTNSGIEFLLGSDLTSATGEPIQIDLTQAAEQATVTATNTLASSVVIDENNSEFTITVDGQESDTLTIPQGTYTQEELAEQVQAVINNSESLGNRDVSVSVTGGALTITTESYGSDSEIANISGDAAATLGFDGSEQDTGVDVAGTFIINGQSESAVGNGRLLAGSEDNELTADLQLLVTLTPDEINATGSEGEVTVTRGITGQLNQFLSDVLDPETGTLSVINDDFDAQIDSLDQSIDRINDQIEAQRQFLVAEFAALESVLADLQNTGNILASQLANLAPNN